MGQTGYGGGRLTLPDVNRPSLSHRRLFKRRSDTHSSAFKRSFGPPSKGNRLVMPPWNPGTFGEGEYPTNPLDDVQEIQNRDAWVTVSKAVTSPIPCAVVKAVMLSNDEIRFINTNCHEYHLNFLRVKCGEKREMAEFNDVVYSGQSRDVICPTIVKYGAYENNSDVYPWTFEMVASDPLLPQTCARVAVAFEKMQAVFGCGKLSIRATTHAQYENMSKPDHPLHRFPRIEPGIVWQGKTYGQLVDGFGTGTLRIVKDANNAKETDALTASDVVFFKTGIPNELPLVAAVIFAEPLPPLCHISLLCRNRRTPCCFDTSKKTAEALAAYRDRPIEVVVKDSNLSIKAGVLRKNVWGVWRAFRLAEPDRTITMPMPLPSSIDQLPPIYQIGAKARNCCIVNLTIGQTDFHANSFVIPMGAYMNHVGSTPIWSSVQNVAKLFNRTTFKGLPSVKDVKAELQHLRQLIMDAPVDLGLLKATKSIIEEFKIKEVILRSSTNAEDLSDFTGAGLYESVHLKVADMDFASLEKAIKTVWASVWLPRAFLERLNVGIESEKVGMCILVQPYYGGSDLAANGVAVTANPNNIHKYGVFVTSFARGEHRATDSVSGVYPEQAMVHMSRVQGKLDVELVSPARGPGINSKKPVCDVSIMEELAEKCAMLHETLLHRELYQSVGTRKAIDVEWLLLNEGKQLLIVQARPCSSK